MKHSVPLRLDCLEDRSVPAVLSLTSVADNTLYEDATGNLSNGAGTHFYAGKTNQTTGLSLRRGLLKFDLSAVPAGSTINSATLKLRMSMSSSGTQNVTVHSVQKNWGEGASAVSGIEGAGTQAVAPDATWTFNFFNTQSWTNPGGDFDATILASAPVNGVGDYQWTGAGLTAAAQQWLNTPAANFGWLIKGNETTNPTAKQFDTREVATAAFRPTLTLDYTAPRPETPVGVGPTSFSEELP